MLGIETRVGIPDATPATTGHPIEGTVADIPNVSESRASLPPKR